MRANVCVNAGRARAPAMAGQAERPAIAGARVMPSNRRRWRRTTGRPQSSWRIESAPGADRRRRVRRRRSSPAVAETAGGLGCRGRWSACPKGGARRDAAIGRRPKRRRRASVQERARGGDSVVSTTHLRWLARTADTLCECRASGRGLRGRHVRLPRRMADARRMAARARTAGRGTAARATAWAAEGAREAPENGFHMKYADLHT